MSELTYADLQRLLACLDSEYTEINSTEDILETTVELARKLVDADICVIAEKENGGLASLAASPSEWTDNDGLLTPASLPSVIASEGISYIIADRGDVRGAAKSEPIQEASTVVYKSALIVPFREGEVLIAGNQNIEAFTDRDLELLRLIGDIGKLRAEGVEDAPDGVYSNEHITNAAANLSHDAKNFLTIIRGRMKLAREDPQAEHFEAIQRASQRLEELIEDTSALLESGKEPAEVEPVPLQEVIYEAWQLEKTESAELVTSPIQSVLADRNRLKQLFENLFRNAVEHAGPDVTVWVGMLSDDQGFYVEDNGPGIDPDEQESVFEFAYSGSEDHQGLGLNIVQWISAAHGWDISVSQGEFGGTRFEFSNVDVVQESNNHQ